MPFSTIDALPTPPTRADGADDFTDKADAFLGAFPTLRSQINTVTSEIAVAAALMAAASDYADPGLKAFAGNTPAADTFPYYTGSSTSALATISSFGRSLIDDADAAAARTTLGLGAVSTLSAINGSTWSGTDLAVADGGTGASTAANARTNLGAAASGANADITSLTALSTALSIAQGGTGATTGGAALAALGFAVTAAGSGHYITIPIGATTYYLQFASGSNGTTEATQSINWPFEFPTACLHAIPSTKIASADDAADFWFQLVGTPGTASVTVQRQQSTSGTNGSGASPVIIGFGY